MNIADSGGCLETLTVLQLLRASILYHVLEFDTAEVKGK